MRVVVGVCVQEVENCGEKCGAESSEGSVAHLQSAAAGASRVGAVQRSWASVAAGKGDCKLVILELSALA